MKQLICGKNSVLDALKNGVKVKTLFLLKTSNVNLNDWIFKGVKIKFISRDQMNLMTDLNHQGYVAILEENFNYTSLEQTIKDQPKIILILDHIEDPHNLGAIIRSANAAGIKHLIIPKNRAVDVNSTVWKVSSGGLVDFKITKVNSLQATLNKLKENNYWIYASALETNSFDYSQIDYNFPLTIIIGNEASGVSKTLLKQSDQIIHIPLYGTVQSLNASVASGIILFEIIKKLKPN